MSGDALRSAVRKTQLSRKTRCPVRDQWMLAVIKEQRYGWAGEANSSPLSAKLLLTSVAVLRFVPVLLLPARSFHRSQFYHQRFDISAHHSPNIFLSLGKFVWNGSFLSMDIH
jgi:hypothetical protein